MALKKKKTKRPVSKKKTVKSVKKSAVKKTGKKKAALKKKKPVKKNVAKKKAALKKKPVKKSITKKKAVAKAAKTKEKVIGSIIHYFPHVRAAVIKLKAPLSAGDTILIKGHTTDFKQTIASMQIDRVPVTSAKVGQEIGLLVDSRVRQHDEVYKI